MTKVVRYKCEWCGIEFKTPHLHKCKWDVDAHNCLSCKHRGKYVGGTPIRVDPDTLGVVEEATSAYFECPFNNGGGGNDFDCGATDPNGNGCEHWELIEGYDGKRTFIEVEREREKKGGAK